MSYNLKAGKGERKTMILINIIIIITLARSLRCLTLLEVEDDPFSPSLTLILANNILIFSSTSIIINNNN